MARTKRQTKAERIFKATYFASLHHVEYWGIDYDAKNFGQSVIGWNALETKDTERVSTRTLNDVEKCANSKLQAIRISEDLQVIDKERADMCRQAVSMVLVTIDNVRRHMKEANELIES